MIDGPIGHLQAMVQEAPESTAVAVICHPHPQQEGTMHNKVVTTLAKAFSLQGVSTIRFNYRGVGESEGSYGDVEGEVEDAEAVVAYAKQRFANQALCMAGFSFGSFIAARIAQQEACQCLVTVAPAVHHADYEQLSGVTCPWLVVMGRQDEVVPFNQVVEWTDSSPSPLQFEVMVDATHFFHGQLIGLRERVVAFYASNCK